MSGGSMDYLHQRVGEASFNLSTPLRRAFRAHLSLVAKALHDIEWVDSGDYGKGDEEAAIRAVLTPGDARLIQSAPDLLAALTGLLGLPAGDKNAQALEWTLADEYGDGAHNAVAAARAAIARAEGRTPVSETPAVEER